MLVRGAIGCWFEAKLDAGSRCDRMLVRGKIGSWFEVKSDVGSR
jgi:hypothetical protein